MLLLHKIDNLEGVSSTITMERLTKELIVNGLWYTFFPYLDLRLIYYKLLSTRKQRVYRITQTFLSSPRVHIWSQKNTHKELTHVQRVNPSVSVVSVPIPINVKTYSYLPPIQVTCTLRKRGRTSLYDTRGTYR